MNKTIVAKISEGLGNQLFMYANAFAISKKFNLDLCIDPYSGYYNKDHYQSFMLNNFNISSQIAPSDWIFSNEFRNLIKKVKIKLDYFRHKKSFFFEKKNFDKSTNHTPIKIDHINDTIYIDGNFESEKYFIDYRNELLKEFSFKDNIINKQNKYLDLIKNNNVVSITIRQNRFSERQNNQNDIQSIQKSEFFVKETVNYILKSIDFIKTKVDNPKFLIWSNDFNNLEKYFSRKEFFYVENSENKTLNDFYLLTQCKNFIVGPSTFSWWGAWLSQKENKICIRPSNINNSNNSDYWPKSWISI